jgi:hypothetical protein
VEVSMDDDGIEWMVAVVLLLVVLLLIGMERAW